MNIRAWAAMAAMVAGILTGMAAATAEAQRYVLRFKVPGLEGFSASGAPAEPSGPPVHMSLVNRLPDGSLQQLWHHEDYLVSRDGASIAFTARMGSHTEAFIRDRAGETTIWITEGREGLHAGTQVAGDVFIEALSSDGRWVVLSSDKPGLVAGPDPSSYRRYLYDRGRDTLETLPLHVGDASVYGVNRTGRYIAYGKSAEEGVQLLRYDTHSGDVDPITVNTAGDFANDSSHMPDGGGMSADGNLVYFTSLASNLADKAAGDPADTNGRRDVFVRDMAAGTTRLVSRAADGGIGNHHTEIRSVIGEVAGLLIQTKATNLVPGGNLAWEPLLWTPAEGFTLAAPGIASFYEPAFSADGSKVCFISEETDLIDTGETIDTWVQIYHGDLSTGTFTLISRDPADGSIFPDGTLFDDMSAPHISADGSTCLFLHYNAAVNPAMQEGENGLVAVSASASPPPAPVIGSDAPPRPAAPVITPVSVAHDGSAPDDFSGEGSVRLSTDGNIVAFSSAATNLIDGLATGGTLQSYVRDLSSGTTTLVSRADDGTPANESSFVIAMSADGQSIYFTSEATNLGASPISLALFRHHRGTGTTEMLMEMADFGTSEEPNHLLYVNDVSDDGRYVLLSGRQVLGSETTTIRQVYRVDTTNDMIENVAGSGIEANSDTLSSGTMAPGMRMMSADGRYVAFTTAASNIGTGDTNGTNDVYLRDFTQPTATRLSVNFVHGDQADGGVALAGVTPDMRHILMRSWASNLLHTSPNAWWDTTSTYVLLDRVAGSGEIPLRGFDGLPASIWNAELATLDDAGRRLCFLGRTDDFVAADTNGAWDVFSHDLMAGTTIWLSQSMTSGRDELSDARAYLISGDGRRCAFEVYGGDAIPELGGHQGVGIVALH